MGNQAGFNTQGEKAVAIGFESGRSIQGINSVAIGTSSGFNNQSREAVAIGYFAGLNTQGQNAVAVGNAAGQDRQGINTVAVGVLAGQTAQGENAIAIGNSAGRTNQGSNAVAIGTLAGNNSQGQNGIAIGLSAGNVRQRSGSIGIGYQAGESTQGTAAIAIGVTAGQTTQGENAIAIGRFAGFQNQQSAAIAIGNEVASYNQGLNAVAIGLFAASTGQGSAAIAIGLSAGRTNQGQDSVAIGNNAGRTGQSSNSVAIGFQSGQNNQGTGGGASVAIGYRAGEINQERNSVAIGPFAGLNTQASGAVAIGSGAGQDRQDWNTIAIGQQAAQTFQGSGGIAIGYRAGRTNQGANAIAIGLNAGQGTQGQNAVAIGFGSGNVQQQSAAIAIGISAGQSGQGTNAIAIGRSSGNTSQGQRAIAIGENAGQGTQGQNAVAIGTLAGQINQHTNTIILNATGSALNSSVASAFYVAPIRQVEPPNLLGYDPTTKEILYLSNNNLTLTSAGNTIALKPTTAGTSYLNLYTGDYSTIGQGNGAVIQFLATPSAPYSLGALFFLNNNTALAGSSYFQLNITDGASSRPILYGVPVNSSGNANIYPPNNLVNLGVSGGQWSSVGTYVLKNNDAGSDLTLSVNNRWVTISPGNLNGAIYPNEGFNTASMSIGWNFSSSQGETTFMNNYGGAGAFDFYDRTGAATALLLARLNKTISYIGNANGSFLTQATGLTSIYSAGTPPVTVNITSWANQGFTVFNSILGGTGFGPNSPGLGISANNNTNISGPTWIIAIAPGINWLNLNLGAAQTFVHYFGTAVAVTNGSGWVNISDAREKINIRDLDTSHSLKKILQCKPKHFNRLIYESGTPISDDVANKVCVGLLAQDVLEFNPGSVDTWKNDKIVPSDADDGTRYSLNYHDFTIHLIGAVKEQNATISALQTEVTSLRSETTSLRSEVELLKSQLQAIMAKLNM